MLELPQRLGLDLADTFAGHRELLADLLERVVGVHADAEAHAQHAFLARGQRGQNAGRRLAEVRLDGRIDRLDGVLIRDEIAEVAESSSSPIGVSRRDRLLGDLQDLADLVERHLQLFGQLFRGRLAADLVQHLPGGADDLVDRFDHVHRNADGAGLVGDRAGDRLPDPPGRIGRELVAAAVLELVDRLHQADIAFLDQVEELQAAIGVFLGDGDDEPKIGLDHLLLGDGRLALALLHLVDDAAVFGDVEAGLGRQRLDLAAQLVDRVALALDEFGPALAVRARRPCRPSSGSSSAAVIDFEEMLALDAIAFGEAQQAAFDAHQPLVDVVELFDQALDTAVVERQRLDVGDHLGAPAGDLLLLVLVELPWPVRAWAWCLSCSLRILP